jgi:hypothetical protein
MQQLLATIIYQCPSNQAHAYPPSQQAFAEKLD